MERPNRPSPPPSLGWLVVPWIERNVVHGNGDYFGQPFKLKPRQKLFIWRCYELRPDGTRRYKKVVKGEPKGKGKTPLVGAIALAEMCGPVVFAGWDDRGRPRGKMRLSPDIPVAAASWDQANLLFGDNVVQMVKEGPLNAILECFDSEILFRDQRPGRLYRVAAAAGTNDGKLPTFLAVDEYHEWTGPRAKIETVLANGVAKRADAWECIISTSGADPGVEMGEPDTPLGKLYVKGKRLQAGEIRDDTFLFDWLEASDGYDLTTDQGILEALAEVYPLEDRLFPIENLLSKHQELRDEGKEYEFVRYFLNRWTSVAESWLDDGAWATGDIGPFEFDPDQPVFVGVDSASKHDSHANLYAQWAGTRTVQTDEGPVDKPVLRVKARIWERPKDEKGRPIEGWKLPIAEVENDLREAHRKYNLDSVNYDPALFERSAQQLELEGLPMVEVPQSNARMVPATQATYELIVQDRLEHDGNPVLARHIASAVAVEVPNGGYRLKKAKVKAKMDAAIALVMAVDAAVRDEGQGTSVYEERGLVTA